MRPDLEVVKLRFGERTYWNIKDPVASRYFQLRDEEYFILSALDGRVQVGELRRRFEQTFAPLRLGTEQLQAYLASLQAHGLLLSERPGQGERLQRQGEARRSAARRGAAANVFAIRFRGVDPHRFLAWLAPKCRWLFHPVTAAVVAAGAVTALGLVVVQYEAVAARLPEFTAFFQPHNLVWAALAIGLAKALHELGHALACARFGGECHELGVLLLVFTPCLYCDVSDAWLMPDKWRRIAVSAAGIVVEIALAAASTFVWWFSEPGLLNTICLNLMIVCSVNTLLFNGNPLLRYDGYYVLADLAEVPNLRERAAAALTGALASLLLGASVVEPRQMPRRARGLLLSYAVAAAVYRVVVICAILGVVHVVLRPHGLEAVAQLLTVLFLVGMVSSWVRRSGRLVRRIVGRKQVKRPRLALSIAAAAAAGFVFAAVPAPHFVSAPLVIEAHEAQSVFAAVAGRLPRRADYAAAGQAVRRGETLVALEAPDIAQRIVELQGRIAALQARRDAFSVLRVGDDGAVQQLPTIEQSLRDLEGQLQQLREQEARLTLRAPIDGVVLPPPPRAAPRIKGELPTWSGTPLDRTSAGGALERGEMFCQVGDPARLVAVLLVDQAEVEFVRPGQRVALWLHELPGERLTGVVLDVAASQAESVPPNLAATEALAVIRDPQGRARPASAAYAVRVSLAPLASPPPIRSTGWARIHAPPRTIAARLWRYLASTFRWS